jgi:hypothetical protein
MKSKQTYHYNFYDLKTYLRLKIKTHIELIDIDEALHKTQRLIFRTRVMTQIKETCSLYFNER